MTAPRIESAPGLLWLTRKNGYVARWQCRSDLFDRGFRPRLVRLWFGKPEDLTEDAIVLIQTTCQQLQAEMLIWSGGGIPKVMDFDGTIAGLIAAYQGDKDSPYRKLRYQTRRHYDKLCDRLREDIGYKVVAKMKARDVLAWHETFVAEKHIPMGHACVGMLRTILTFGCSILENDDCLKIRERLRSMRFQMGKAREVTLTAGGVVAIRAEAHKQGHPSIALAQAIQFDCMLRQKDVIGEWVPISEPGISPITRGNNKWLRGLRWEEIDQHLILTHITSKRQKEVTVDLSLAPMVMEELQTIYGTTDRARLPASGPVIVSNGLPWLTNEFSRHWRRLATACGIPGHIRNMDSRAGAITEATEAGAPLESIKQAATHSDISMTQRYARGQAEKTEDVMRLRANYRQNKSGSNGPKNAS